MCIVLTLCQIYFEMVCNFLKIRNYTNRIHEKVKSECNGDHGNLVSMSAQLGPRRKHLLKERWYAGTGRTESFSQPSCSWRFLTSSHSIPAHNGTHPLKTFPPGTVMGQVRRDGRVHRLIAAMRSWRRLWTSKASEARHTLWEWEADARRRSTQDLRYQDSCTASIFSSGSRTIHSNICVRHVCCFIPTWYRSGTLVRLGYRQRFKKRMLLAFAFSKGLSNGMVRT